MKKTSHPQQHISSQSRLYKGRKGARRRWRVILMNIWQRFFSLYPPVDSLSDFYKTHPSLMSVRLSLNWLEIYLLHSLTLRKKQFSTLQILGVNYSTLSEASLSIQRRNKWKIKYENRKVFKVSVSFCKHPCAELHSPTDCDVEKPDSALRLTSLFSLCHFYLPVHMLFSVHLSVARASPWQERSLSTTVPANQSDVSHRSSDN